MNILFDEKTERHIVLFQMLSLLDTQAKYILPSLFVLFIIVIYKIESTNLKFCWAEVDFSNSLNLTTFACTVNFSFFGVQQIIQLLNFATEKNKLFLKPLIKINLSNLFISLICFTTHYLAHFHQSGGICVDNFGYYIFIYLFIA